MSDDEVEIATGLFEEPEGYVKPPPECHFAKYNRKGKDLKHGASEITLRLVGSSPLWGHLLWNAGIYTADFLDKNASTLVEGKRVLELGAASALPSLIAAINNAKEVISTDYPDPELTYNIQCNFDSLSEQFGDAVSPYKVKGYIWGNDVREFIYEDFTESTDISEEDKFDTIILSDVVFNHTEHHKLLQTCRNALKKTGQCLVVFSPHRAKLLHKDLEFFTLCEEYELKAEQIEMVSWSPMFEEEEETAQIRARVYSYYLKPQW